MARRFVEFSKEERFTGVLEERVPEA